jgi:hypothetical protein
VQKDKEGVSFIGVWNVGKHGKRGKLIFVEDWRVILRLVGVSGSILMQASFD